MGIGQKHEPAYENDYTLWARLENDTFESVRSIIFKDVVEHLYADAQLLH